jgi:hypothetical protein
MTQTSPSIREKQMAEASFTTLFDNNRNRNLVPSWVKYGYEYTHDGFGIYNNSSNHFEFSELEIIKDFCDMNDYSFSAIGRETKSPSMYGSVLIEISICK